MCETKRRVLKEEDKIWNMMRGCQNLWKKVGICQNA